METTITLEHGPMKVEIHALNDENYQEEVLDLIQFIEENQERFEELGMGTETSEMTKSRSEETSLEQFTKNESEEDQEEVEEEETGPLSSIASELRVSANELRKFLHSEPEEEDFPVLYVDELGEIGERKTDRQRVASLVLLYVWHECYDIDRVKSTDLKDALELSNISATGMGNMYQGEGDRYFDRAGRGPSATVRLTPPGKRQARKVLRQFVQQLQENE
jgi:hypothetical protein